MTTDLSALWLTFQLAAVTTIILLIIATPLAWWLTTTKSWLRVPVGAITSLPLVLPPTVLGFYLLVAMGPDGPIGNLTQTLGIGLLPFTFEGLVVGSIVYSLPFVLQPIQNAMSLIGNDPLEVAATLGASRVDRFFSVVLPMAKPGFISGAVLGFAHTVGEFGIVLMIGGNIPDETRVVSIEIYDHVEALQYSDAHWLSFILVSFSFVILMLLGIVNRQQNALLR